MPVSADVISLQILHHPLSTKTLLGIVVQPHLALNITHFGLLPTFFLCLGSAITYALRILSFHNHASIGLIYSPMAVAPKQKRAACHSTKLFRNGL